MQLATSLLNIYNKLEEQGDIRITPRIQKDDKERTTETILPIFMVGKGTEIEIVVNAKGEVKNVIYDEFKIPFLLTTKSVNKTSSYEPHVLFEQLGSLMDTDKLNAFLTQLNDWIDYQSVERVEILRDFYTKYFADKNPTLLVKLKEIAFEAADDKGNSDSMQGELNVQSILEAVWNKSLDKHYIRVRVELNDGDEDALWYSESVYQSYLNYRNFQILNAPGRDTTEICMLTGGVTNNTTHLTRGVLAMKKLFCFSNDVQSNFFNSLVLDEINSWKISNVIEWLMKHRRYSIPKSSDNILIWEDNLHTTNHSAEIAYLRSTFSFNPSECIQLDTENKELNILFLNSRENGRMLIKGFEKHSLSKLEKSLNHWYNTLVWAIADSEGRNKTIHSSINEVLELSTDKDVFNYKDSRGNLFYELVNKKIQGKNIPVSYLAPAKLRLLRKLSDHKTRMKEKHKYLRVYCSLYNHNNFKGAYNLELDKNKTDRNYLYGRLLAIAHYFELNRKYSKKIANGDFNVETSFENKKSESTLALKMIQGFEKNPARTWSFIFKELVKRYKKDITFPKFLNQVNEVIGCFERDAFSSNKHLTPEYLLAFSLQLNHFKVNKMNEKSGNQTDNTIGENEEISIDDAFKKLFPN